MFEIGSCVEFAWWSVYRARSFFKDSNGNTKWFSVDPGNRGIILNKLDDDKYSVLFSNLSEPVIVHQSMLKLA